MPALFLKWAFPQVTDSALFSDLFLSLAKLSFVLHLLSVRRHITLSSDQLGFIEIYKKTEVVKDFDAILQQMPSTDIQEE